VIGTRGSKASADDRELVIEHREALILMICEAAEMEHALMCEYLFAAFSLKERQDEGLTAEQIETAILADVAVGLMYDAIEPLGRMLGTMPVGPGHPGATAGAPFELFYQPDYLLPTTGLPGCCSASASKRRHRSRPGSRRPPDHSPRSPRR
jgi:hypothetical protein